MLFLVLKSGVACQGQDNSDSLIKDHTIIVPDKPNIILPSPADDQFCLLLSNIRIPSEIKFRDTDYTEISYFIQIIFTIDASGNSVYVNEKIKRKNLDSVIKQIKDIIKQEKWETSGNILKAVLSCKLMRKGLIEITVSSEDNFKRQSYCSKS